MNLVRLSCHYHIDVVLGDSVSGCECAHCQFLGFATDPGIRLVGGSGPHEGRMEVYHNGTWGTVCDDGWDLQDAIVVCHQLGYFNVTAALRSASFGAGSGPIFFSNLSCSGNNSHITVCPNHGSADLNCTHSEDAGVTCEGESAAVCVCLWCGVCLCVSVSEFFTGWMEVQGLIFVTNAILKDM